MKKFIIQAILLILVIGVGIVFFNPTNSKKIDIPFLPQQHHFANLQINDTTLKVELADTPTRRSKGLSGRTSLAQSEGMLFIFDKSDKHPFWMKGLTFPLDFIWIQDEKIVDILENISFPSPGQPDSSIPIYSAKVEVDKVLEVNAGTVKRLNIKVGDIIKID